MNQINVESCTSLQKYPQTLTSRAMTSQQSQKSIYRSIFFIIDLDMSKTYNDIKHPVRRTAEESFPLMSDKIVLSYLKN